MVRPPRFHTKPLRRKRSIHWRKLLFWIALLATTIAVAIYVRLPGNGEDWNTLNPRFSLCSQRDSAACVIDGDTIMIGRGRAGRKIRMSGYNAPEMEGECEAEKLLARQSRDALRDWLNSGAFLMSGGTQPPYDQYGRELREFRRGDEWLADTMVAQGLAQESGWGFTRGGWCE